MLPVQIWFLRVQERVRQLSANLLFVDGFLTIQHNQLRQRYL